MNDSCKSDRHIDKNFHLDFLCLLHISKSVNQLGLFKDFENNYTGITLIRPSFFDVECGNVCLDHLFAGMFWDTRYKHMVFHRCEYVGDFSMHQNDESVYHMCHNHNGAHCDELIDADRKRIQSKMICRRRHNYKDVPWCEIYGCDRSSLDGL